MEGSCFRYLFESTFEGNAKLKRKFGIIAIVLVVRLILGACGSSNADSPFVGVWNATSYEMEGMVLTAESFGDSVIEVKPNGSLNIDFIGEKASGKWKETDNGFVITSSGEEFPLTIQDGILVMEYEGIRFNFVKEGSASVVAQATDVPTVEDTEAPEETEVAEVTQPVATETEESGQTAVQAIWNGKWYGLVWVTEARGEWAESEGMENNAFLYIDIDDQDEGNFEIYLEDPDSPTVVAKIKADEYHFEVVDGVFWDYDLDPSVW